MAYRRSSGFREKLMKKRIESPNDGAPWITPASPVSEKSS